MCRSACDMPLVGVTAIIMSLCGCGHDPAKYVFRIEVNNRFGAINEYGEFVVDPVFSIASRNSAEEMLLGRDGIWVYCSPIGVRDIAVPEGSYDLAVSLRDGLFWLGRAGEQGVVVDTKNRLKPTTDYTYSMYSYSEGMVVVRTGDLEGFADRDGALVIAPRFLSVRPFSEGLAAVEMSTGFGYIDKRGEFVIPPFFAYALDFHEELALVFAKSNKSLFINKSGTEAIHLESVEPSGSFSLGRAKVRDVRTGKSGYVDRSGRVVIPPSFDIAGDFTEGLAWTLCSDGNGKYIDEHGRSVLSFENVKKMQPFACGIAFVETRARCGYVDRRGKWVWSQPGSSRSQKNHVRERGVK